MQAMTRRTFLPVLAAPALASAAPATGRLKQGATMGVFRGAQMTLDDMCREAARQGIYGFDLIKPEDWPTLKKYGLTPTMTPPPYGGTISDALNVKENHDRIEKTMREIINVSAAAGCPNVITFSGNRRGMPDDQGAENCVLFLNKVKAQAEDKGVTICMELLNSKVNHKDYMCDHAAWGVGVMKQVNSPRVKLLYDIYHMQIMDGDIVRTFATTFNIWGIFIPAETPAGMKLIRRRS